MLQIFSGIAFLFKPPWLELVDFSALTVNKKTPRFTVYLISLKTRCVDMENQRMLLAWQLIAFKGKLMALSHLEVYQNTKHYPKLFLFNCTYTAGSKVFGCYEKS